MSVSTVDKKEREHKKIYSHTATKETIDHYKRCEKAILALCKHGDYSCSLVGDNWRWYKVNFEEKKAKLWLASEESYEFLIHKHRTLYRQCFPVNAIHQEAFTNER